MSKHDEIRVANEQHWNRMVEEGCGYTIPWLDLDPVLIRQYAKGELETLPEREKDIFSFIQIADVEDKDILCLALGGGQQSAVFGLLGGRVTVVDLAQGQLDGDRKAAAHYGYEITTIHADMRDLSCLSDESFDIVYGTGMCYIPDVREVYSEVARVLRTGGIYRVDFGQPAVHFVAWDGEAYRITKPYAEKIDQREDGAIEFRHYLDDIFNGILAVGMSIQQVQDSCRYQQPDPKPPSGSWTHHWTYVGGRFVIVARKESVG
jgi:ubiquinone/menaquinone biosynthesis C-methylase UbiE